MTLPAKRWTLPPPPASHSLPRDLPPAAVQVLLRRGIDTAEKLRLFLQPAQRLPYDPMRLRGMEQALQRLYRAVQHGEKVGVFGDFDVDGLTGTAIVAQGLEALGVPVVPYLPHRLEEGHGLSGDALRRLAAQGVRLIITVDCGVTSLEEVAQARGLGMDVIITDHHTPLEQLPQAVAILNPRLTGSRYPFPSLSGAGLAFKLVQGLYQLHGQPWPPGILGLAALGTIADLVPLMDENRFIVQQGLAELARTRRPGLLALYRRASINPQALTAESLAFQVVPRLNSAGRMSHALDSYKLLTTNSDAEGEALADKLEEMNRDRRRITEAAWAAAQEQVYQRPSLPPVLLVEDASITPGIAGLVAGRLAETFYRPAVALAARDCDLLVASGRSIPEFNMVQAFAACQDLFVRFGGHAQAAGFTLHRSKLPLLEERLTEIAQRELAATDLRPALAVDAEVGLGDLHGSLTQWLASLEPFGQSNPQPMFLTRGLRVLESRYMGNAGQHLFLRVRDGSHEWNALAFNQASGWAAAPSRIDLVYGITPDSRRGNGSLALKVADWQPSGG